MRIIAGTHRSRNIAAPAGLDTRPTSDRLRETLFNVLAPRIENAVFLDLYAGSGAVGIEALSRGAASAVFVERAARALHILRGNLTELGLSKDARVCATSVSAYLRRPLRAEVYDLVFLDPPYDHEKEYESTLNLLGGSCIDLLAPEALVVAEHRRQGKLADGYGRLARKRLLQQGDAALSFYAASPSA